ncbi:MAG TPA: hypothetical protein VJT31_22980 [Rugosimonospora sp.]|nr:hypothetical protein [Rugosimonospora sp.]
MAPQDPVPAKLARLLETLDPEDRQEIVAWLLTARWPAQQMRLQRWRGDLGVSDREEVLRLRRQLASWLPAGGEGNQLVTIRLPAEQHERLRTWCGDHNFTMAAVVRGLIERFLEERGSGAPRSDPASD